MKFDLILVGGGLANGLLADRLAATRPELSFVVLELGATLGGNHTWSFHGSDVSESQRAWLARFCGGNWEAHDVSLPGVTRQIAGSYHSIRSEDFDRELRQTLGERVRTGCRVGDVSATRVVLESGEVLEAGAVLDARAQAFDFPAGFQKFLGQDLELEAPHGLSRPMLMDATVAQLEGFRFVYALPWSERRVLVEDTRYSDTPELDLPSMRVRIAEWVNARGWKIASVLREEAAALPIPLGGKVPQPDRPVLGVAAGLFHATTGYSLPFAAQLAETLCASPALDAASLTQTINRIARAHWDSQSFFRLLNRMLFRGAAPEERVKIFSSFYGHDDELIGRFYAGKLTLADKMRALQRGAPTVPPIRAMRAALGLS
ncbi:MAG: lycopene beta-cyclase CrtY [Archangium sp.]|nr:lycopene beta-cyclase CrtY [Archangium sp.]